jgi:hypothetical protein
MKHLSEEQLNEYLDDESREREQIELHLATCNECAARLDSLRALFNELDSLPELALSRDLAAPVMRTLSLPGQLPKWLTLTALLQTALALVAAFIAAPFIMEFASASVPVLQMPSLGDAYIQLQLQWNLWLDMLSTIQMPSMPEIPVMEMSSLMLMTTLVGVFMLWLVGNGLLLRNQIK